MKRTALKFLKCGVIAMLAILFSASAAALEWVQIARVSGDNVCGKLETDAIELLADASREPWRR